MSYSSTWAVRVDPTPISNNDSSSAETANVRGGRGERGGRAFVRQPQQQQQQQQEQQSGETTNNHNPNDNYTEQHDTFLTWCRDSLGIDTSLVEIDYFDYPDYLKAMEDKIDIFYEDYKYDEDEEDDDEEDEYNNHYLDEEDRYLSVIDEYPSIIVRGLKASQDISVGEVVLSIPHSALWTVHNAIDASGDKNLVNSMGPKARQSNGWESPGMDEIPLLAVTLLYHMMELENNNHAPYLELLQTHNLQDSIPHLWDSRKLRKSATPSVLRVAQGIRKDVVDLYEAIVMVLIESHPDVFGIPETDDEEWMFSLEKFHWAFALINSRHWHLEIPDDPFVEEEITESPQTTAEAEAEELPSANQEPANPPEDDHESFTDQEGPPAATPTDEWVVIQDEKLREEEERELKHNGDGETANETASNDHAADDTADEDYEYWPSGNSFLAPLADLLNFGPPCTRGTYNPITMAFEIVATCEFQKGQEITFWYTDACEDIFVANYGFTMPMMVPKCTKHTATSTTSSSNSMKEDFLLQQQQQEQQQEYLEDELFHAYQELDRLDRRLDFLMNVLEDCHCGNQTELLAGAWDYASSETNNEEDGQDVADVESADKQIPLPKSPSPPTSRPTKKESKKGPDAQHAIRDGRSRKTKKSGDSTPEVHRHRHRHHGSMTRFRSHRNHQGRRVDHEF